MNIKNSQFTFFVLVFIAAVVFILMGSLQKENVVISKIQFNNDFVDSTLAMKTLRVYNDSINQIFQREGMVGAAYTIVENNHVLATKSFGVKWLDSNDSVNSNTIFKIASLSKGFASLLAVKLQEDSVIDLSLPIVHYFPSLQLRLPVNTNQLTMRHILSHTSGLAPYSFDNLIENGVSLKYIIPQLMEADIASQPGTIYGYQNVVYSLIDTLLVLKTHLSYAQLIQQKIFEPLGMKNASVGGSVFANPTSNTAKPHIGVKDNFRKCDFDNSYYSVLPAAGVNASINDLSIWLLALLGNYPQVIDSFMLNAIETPVIQTPLKYSYYQYWTHKPEKYYSLGWRIFIYRGRKIIHHGGYVKGYRAEIAFCPEEKIGIAFLQNCGNRVASHSIPLYFDLLFDKIDMAKKTVFATKLVKNNN